MGVILERVKKSFWVNNIENVILEDISFKVEKGKIISIIGPSGCGKTTLLKMIGGLEEITSGEINISGKSTSESIEKNAVSYVFQNPVLLPWRNAIDNVNLPLEIVESNGKSPSELLRLVGLEEYENHYPNELSGGMQQRVALARALTYHPKVLLMDEPFGALDSFTRQKMNDLLLEIWRTENQPIIFFITHSISEAVYLSDYVLVLTNQPTKVAQLVEIDLKRPRLAEILTQPQFNKITECVNGIMLNGK